MSTTTILYRPVGPTELKLIEDSGWAAFPPRLPEQPIFYPVTNEEYAIQIARDWNVTASGSGFVTKFAVDSDFLARYPVQIVGGRQHSEHWIPADELDEFNRHICGRIEVTQSFHRKGEMLMKLKSYPEQEHSWPSAGRHILASYDESSITVYQAYRPAIASFALRHQRFGGEFSFTRMSWIKPNFLWMMYRSGWASKEGQEMILAVKLPRLLFDEMLAQAVPSSFNRDRYATEQDWKRAVSDSDVRLQWDPDHTPSGAPCQRRAVQLGLRGEMLRRYAQTELFAITDVTELAIRGREHASHASHELMIPEERVYHPAPPEARKAIDLDIWKPVA